MAKIHAGIDVRGSDWEFLGSTWFLALMVVITAVWFISLRNDTPRRLPQAAFAGIFGAIAGAASLVEQGESAGIGLIVGLLVGVGSALIATDVLVGAQRRAARPRRGSTGDQEAAAAATLDLIFAARRHRDRDRRPLPAAALVARDRRPRGARLRAPPPLAPRSTRACGSFGRRAACGASSY